MVDERRKRIPQPWLWAVAGAALVFVFVFVVAPSLLIRPPKTGLSPADELKARNDVRTTLVQALAGLAVAGGLVVTYRTYRQNRAEQDRTYERELYAKAVEQLGHGKAPVRLGALYSLERLAEDKPERRQTIVNVICAYLRMPFSPIRPAIKPEPRTTKAAGEAASESEARTDGIGDTSRQERDDIWWQEREVRLTAQRILAEHLRDDRSKDKRAADPPNSRFWPNIRLNLVGATLIDFSLENWTVADADFSWATFSGFNLFSGATFDDFARFNRATFDGFAMFDGVTFGGDAVFAAATFTVGADFRWTTFSGLASFGAATVSGVMFHRATFSRKAVFQVATFRDDAEFEEATFEGDADFNGAAFGGDARFIGTTFKGDARFDDATFEGDARFVGATFNGRTIFDDASFSGNARFDTAIYNGGDNSLSFKRSRVLSSSDGHVWPTGLRLGQDSSHEYTVVRANDGLDTGVKPEEPPAAGTAGGA